MLQKIEASAAELIDMLGKGELDKQLTYGLKIKPCTAEQLNHILNELISQGLANQIIELHLYKNNLASLPAEIGQFTALTVLNLNRNYLTSLPAEIGQLTALTVLELKNNKLTILPAEIGQLMALTRLSLYNNQLTDLPPEIGQLKALAYLNLCFNQLTSRSLPSEIWRVTTLTTLGLDDNELTSLPPEIGQLTALKVLRLNANQLTSLPSEIRQLTNLTALTLGDNQFTSLPAEIEELKKLTFSLIGTHDFSKYLYWLNMLTKRNKKYKADFNKVSDNNDWKSLKLLARDFLIKGIDSFSLQLDALLKDGNPYAEDFQMDYCNLLAKQALEGNPANLKIDLDRLLTDLVKQSAINDGNILFDAINHLYVNKSAMPSFLLLHLINIKVDEARKVMWTNLRFLMLNKLLKRDIIYPSQAGDNIILENQLNVTRVFTLKTLSKEIHIYLSDCNKPEEELFLKTTMQFASGVIRQGIVTGSTDTAPGKTYRFLGALRHKVRNHILNITTNIPESTPIPEALKNLTPTEFFKISKIRKALNLGKHDTAVLLEHVIVQPACYQEDSQAKELPLPEIMVQLEELKSPKNLQENAEDYNDNNIGSVAN